jgi:transcriptional regulator with PAS, ATPase and Fis domain
MQTEDWTKQCPMKIMILDRDGLILEMNDRSAENYAEDGGRDLIGKNVYDCHPEPSRTQLRKIVEHDQPTLYTTERAGVKEMICLMPWFKNGEHVGLVHIEFEIPFDLPHYVRDAAPAPDKQK